ncbi:uncharacterized protein LOC112884682 [Panicum hallii]|uniref:uncharacterized protein LOC112884682 n=1 Tax=Panicum hallii TaxID=206008 RepID=UPI000DF4DC9E|nr:uncharacterized protein LOC112884682 [Panicum hallii]XP_025805946.1 uncharacterized protein LOC112884682 [Panicum hallii]
MPGNIHISATQPPAITPLFLQVGMGKREYSGNIEQDGLSIPVTSLRDSMVMMLYNADRELISKSELKTKAILESGTMDVVFTLDSGGKIILQVQLVLNDDDRKRIQEMRNSAMKRKQQALLGDGYELNFPDSPLSKRLIEKINIQSKGDGRPKLRKSVSLDDLQERAVFSGINVDPRMKASRNLLLQRGVRNTSRFEDPSSSKKGNSKPESKSSSSVKKMISAFEGTSPQGLSSDIDASLTDSGIGSTQAGKAIVPFGDNKGSNYRSGKTVLFQHKKSSAPGQIGMSSPTERRSGRSSSGDRANKQKLRENELNRTKRRSQAKHRRSIIGPSYSLERMHSRDYVEHSLNYLVATSSTRIHPHICVTTASKQLKDLLELEHWKSHAHMKHTDKNQEITSVDESIASAQTRSGGFPVLNGWLINQGVRGAIVVIACGAMFLNSR